jgi:pyruvate dehydrogenase E1 component
VSQFGQSGDVQDLHRHLGIDTETIVGAALDLSTDQWTAWV